MSRKSITFTEKNEIFLKKIVQSKEYSTQSEYINELLRKERESLTYDLWLAKQAEKGIKSERLELTKDELWKTIRKNSKHI